MTRIEWCDESWNPITGCSPCSEGCEHCYAARMSRRLRGRFGYPSGPRDAFAVTFHRDRLDQPSQWRTPRRIFVCSMGDLWHPDVKRGHQAEVFAAARAADWHTYLFLTKRPENVPAAWGHDPRWWLGVTVENQRRADQRIPLLVSTNVRAAVRFVSCEPLLESIVPVWPQWWWHMLDWLIIGPETGPHRRQSDPQWIKSLIRQADYAGLPVFVKAFPVDGRISKDPSDWPEWARRREFPS